MLLHVYLNDKSSEINQVVLEILNLLEHLLRRFGPGLVSPTTPRQRRLPQNAAVAKQQQGKVSKHENEGQHANSKNMPKKTC